MVSGGLLGKKMGMMQIFDDTGTCTPVTVLQVGPCTVIQKKTQKSDGYSAVQIGFEPLDEKKVNKPRLGHFRSQKLKPFRFLREFRIPDEETYEVGQTLDIGLFRVGDKVDVTGVSKGKGFQGVMKRYGHKGGPGAHGSHFHRTPGSIGQCTYPGEVQKGQKMPGRMGFRRVTSRNLKIVAVRPEENIILTRGSIPGSIQSLIFVRLDTDTLEQRIKERAPASVDETPEETRQEETPTEETTEESKDS